MICRTCNGSGHLYTHPAEWWPCPACGGAGARVMFGPAVWTRRRRHNAREKPSHPQEAA